MQQSRKDNDQDVPAPRRSQGPSGLLLVSIIIDRVRRLVPKDNTTTVVVTYTVQDFTGKKHFVDDFAPESFYTVGDSVSLPVYVKTYNRKNGNAAYTLNVLKTEIRSRGEQF